MTEDLSLALAPTDALIAELSRRYEHLIFAGYKARPVEGLPTNAIRTWRFQGMPEICQGLACMIIRITGDFQREHDETIDSSEL
jgi:hypothetical protein